MPVEASAGNLGRMSLRERPRRVQATGVKSWTARNVVALLLSAVTLMAVVAQASAAGSKEVTSPETEQAQEAVAAAEDAAEQAEDANEQAEELAFAPSWDGKAVAKHPGFVRRFDRLKRAIARLKARSAELRALPHSSTRRQRRLPLKRARLKEERERVHVVRLMFLAKLAAEHEAKHKLGVLQGG
jgi:hypothetical protein